MYLIGATREVVNKTSEVLKEKYPKLKFAGVHDGYFKDNEWIEICEKIKEGYDPLPVQIWFLLQ